MAPSLRGTTNDGNTSGSLTSSGTINVPPGVANGDLLILLYINFDGDGSKTQTAAGWTNILDQRDGNVRTGLWWRIASSEPASYTFSITNSVFELFMVAIQNPYDTVTPFVDNQTTTATPSGPGPSTFPVDSPTATAVSNADLAFVFFSTFGNPTYAAATGYTEREDHFASATEAGSIHQKDTVAAGTIAAATFTTTANSLNRIVQLVVEGGPPLTTDQLVPPRLLGPR